MEPPRKKPQDEPVMRVEDCRIMTVSVDSLSDYCKVPIRFRGTSVLEVRSLENGFGGIILEERDVTPFYKDYDAWETPRLWPEQFDTANWRFYLAMAGTGPVGAATLAMKTRGVRMLEGRDDLACLWDLRVHPEWRGQGLGTELFRTAALDARASGYIWLKVETQNNNVGANRFYHGQGCHLGQVHLHAYDHEPGGSSEVMLIWYLDLKDGTAGH